MKTLLRELKETGVDLGGMQMKAGEADMRQKLRDLEKIGVINNGAIQWMYIFSDYKYTQ